VQYYWSGQNWVPNRSTTLDLRNSGKESLFRRYWGILTFKTENTVYRCKNPCACFKTSIWCRGSIRHKISGRTVDLQSNWSLWTLVLIEITDFCSFEISCTFHHIFWSDLAGFSRRKAYLTCNTTGVVEIECWIGIRHWIWKIMKLKACFLDIVLFWPWKYRKSLQKPLCLFQKSNLVSWIDQAQKIRQDSGFAK
jgi:hypothetical protein